MAAILLLTSVSSTGAGASNNLGAAYEDFTIQLAINSGTVSTIALNLEGSLDGIEWFTLSTITKTTNGAKSHSQGKPVYYVRANLTNLTGSSPVISCYVAYYSASGGGGGGGAVTIADGADITQGSQVDSAATNSTSSWSIVALLKGLFARTPTVTNQNSELVLLNELANQIIVSGQTIPFTYSSPGVLQTITKNGVVFTFNYNGNGDLTSITT